MAAQASSDGVAYLPQKVDAPTTPRRRPTKSCSTRAVWVGKFRTWEALHCPCRRMGWGVTREGAPSKDSVNANGECGAADMAESTFDGLDDAGVVVRVDRLANRSSKRRKV